MATYVLIHGAGSDSWYWHLVVPELQARGHEVVAVDLPCDDDSAGLADYADTVIAAIGERQATQADHGVQATQAGHGVQATQAGHGVQATQAGHGVQATQAGLVVVAQSMGAFTAPLICDRVPVRLLVLVAAMVPAPGESPGDWWANTGWQDPGDDLFTVFMHDLPPALAQEAWTRGGRPQSGTPFEKPWPLPAWPDVATRVLLCRDDRFFPAEFQRRVVQERLGIVPDEMDGGHLPALSRPRELADRLEAYRREFV